MLTWSGLRQQRLGAFRDEPADRVGTRPHKVTATLARQYAKLCDPRDFDYPAVRDRIDAITPDLEPAARFNRKHWEYAMLTLFLEESGLLRDDARILSVGAGHETVLFWLANRVEKVVATDIYG